MLGRRIKHLVGHDVPSLGRTRELLVCAAIEGRRFTLEAVAEVLGRPAGGMLDGRLPLDDPRDGLIAKAGLVRVDDERRLHRYRFGAELVWLTLSHSHDLAPDRRSERAGELADALSRLYGSQAHRVAAVLARLYRLAGNAEAARHFQRLADIGVDRMIILWRARRILDSPAPTHPAERSRASDVLIMASEKLLHSGPFHEGRRFAEAARQFAPLTRDVARAMYLAGVHGSRIGLRDEARRELSDVVALYGELKDRRSEASARQALASIDLEEGEYATALEQLMEVLSVFRELGDQRNEAHTLHQIAGVLIHAQDYEDARDVLAAALRIFEHRGELEGVAGVLLQLARLRVDEGDLDRAEDELDVVLGLFEQLGDQDGEAATRRHLARVHLQRRAYARARDELVVALGLLRSLGFREAALAVQEELGRIPGV